MNARFLGLTFLLPILACGSEADTATQSQEIDQDSSDLTVLTTTVGPTISVRNGVAGDSSAPGFDPAQCDPLPDAMLDCTDLFERVFRVPALGRIVLSKNTARCNILLVQTVSQADAADASDGVGSFYSVEPDNQDRGRFVAKKQLSKVRDATLKNGAAAVVYQFGGLAYCDAGGRWGHTVFKPYMRFTSKSTGKEYKNWDARPRATSWSNGNYGLDWNHVSFDRSAELLR